MITALTHESTSRGGSKTYRGTRQTTDWELQDVVKSKVTSKCFWNACKALSFGLFLMFIGTTMAILGYFADQLSVVQELRGNTTVRIKHESRGFHLNNLSYAGPIVMGVGGFIVVAACVMTFEARDSAAKIVPTPRTRHPGSYHAQRSKSSRFHRHGSSIRSSMIAAEYAACSESRRSTSSQTAAGAALSGRVSPVISDLLSRRELTRAFVQFSRDLGVSAMSKSPSAPDLSAQSSSVRGLDGTQAVSSVRAAPMRAQALLSPHYLLQRQALSVDNSDYGCALVGCFSPPGLSRASIDKEGGHGPNGSQTSMAMDLHLDNPVTIRVRDRGASRGSTRRHLIRQRPIELNDDSEHSPRARRHDDSKRQSRGSGDVQLNSPLKRRRSRTLRRKSQGSRSASDRSTDRASPDQSVAQLKTSEHEPPSDNSSAGN